MKNLKEKFSKSSLKKTKKNLLTFHVYKIFQRIYKSCKYRRKKVMC